MLIAACTDKHQRPEAKQQAETKFHRIQEAYEGQFSNFPWKNTYKN